jgi:hypothetical protein
MTLEFHSLLPIQREIYTIPRGMDRFRTYLRTMIDAKDGDLQLPLAEMNPMGKEHVLALIDAYLALGAEELAAKTACELTAETAAVPGEFKVGLVVVDDAKGGWTNRYTAEFNHCFQEQALQKRGWLVALLWTTEKPTTERIVAEVRAVAYRAVYQTQHGQARTLHEMLAQEGAVQARVGGSSRKLSAAEIAHTWDVVGPLLEAADMPEILSVLFGDSAARELGYTPLGLEDRAGLSLARVMAEQKFND